MRLPNDVEHAVKRLQRLLIKDISNGRELEREGWSDEACRRVRAATTSSAISKARAHLDDLLTRGVAAA